MRAKTTISIILGLVLCVSCMAVRASDKQDFMISGISARPSAMGQSYVAVTDGSDSTYWNPASLALVEVVNLNSVHSSISDFDMNTDMISLASPIGSRKSAIGLSLFRSTVSGFDHVDLDTRPDSDYTFNSSEIGILGGYGLMVSENLLLGATVKHLRTKFDGHGYNGTGLDLGILYMATENLNIGANLQNVIPVDFGADEVPFNAKVGFAYRTPCRRFTLAADVDTNIMDETVFHAGAEFWIVPQLALRMGTNDGDLTAGIGLAGLSTGWNFDYAYDNGNLGDVHRVSVLFDFESKTEPKKIAPKEKKEIEVSKAVVKEPAPAPKPAPAPVAKPEPKPKPAPAPKPESVPEPAPTPKPVQKPAPAPKVEIVVPAASLALIDAYTFYEGDDVISISYTDLKAGQSAVVYRSKAKIAEVKITDVGMLSSSGKITKLYVDKIEDYMIGDQIGIED